MAIGKASDFVIYQEQFFGGMTEVLMQQSQLFNNASRGAIQLVPQRLIGDYEKESFFKSLGSGLVSRRDTTSVASATDTALTMGENVAVKLNRKIGPVAQTLDALRKIGKDNGEISLVLGQQLGQAVALDYLNTALLAACPAFAQTYAYDASAEATPTMTHTILVNGLSKYGDAANNVVCWVMHSKVWFDLMKQAISDKIVEVAGSVIYNGTVATLNRPVLVTDSAALISTAPAPDEYLTLGLTPNSIVIKESEQQEVVSQIITGLENLVYRIQGEYAYNLELKGYTWDVAHGGANPLDAAVATASNWDKTASDDRSTGGVVITTQ